MAKDPAFLFYSADFMMGAMTLSMEQRGQYITLLSIMHQKGRLTKEEVEFVIGGNPSISLTKKFKIDEQGNWYNERLEAEIAKRSEFTKSRRKSLEIDNGDMVHLYLISDPETRTIKIGSSKYPELRLKEVKKYKPGAEFIWISEILFERKNEKILHEEFVSKKFKYDWFHLTKEDIERIRTKYCDVSRTKARTVNENVNEDRNGNDDLEKLKEYAVWTDQILEGDDHLFHNMFAKESIPPGEHVRFLILDHRDLLSRYPKMRPPNQQAFRNSCLKHIRQNYQKSKTEIKKLTLEDLKA